MGVGAGCGVCFLVCETFFFALGTKNICYTMSRSSLAPAHQHDLTLSHLLLTLSSP